MNLENIPTRDAQRPEEPELQIITPDTRSELTHLPPGVAEDVIGNIEREEKGERRREKEIERKKRPTLH